MCSFNVINDIDEKLGGIPYIMRKSPELIEVIEACGIINLCFSGKKFTWNNKKGINQRNWKSLDRTIINDHCLQNISQTIINHLLATGSYHCPVLMEIVPQENEALRYFRFLNSWVDNPDFMEVVET